MTLDEAIKERQKVIEVQEKLYEEASTNESKEIIKSAIDNDRQLVEWLTELKDLREKYREVVMEGEKLNADYTEQVALNEQYKKREEQYKRLLKAAVEDMRWINENTQDDEGSCVMRKCEGCGDCPLDINGDLWCKWKHEEAALKLIGETNEP